VRENAYRRNLSPRVPALSQLAKRRTIPRRQAQVEGCASVAALPAKRQFRGDVGSTFGLQKGDKLLLENLPAAGVGIQDYGG